MSNIFSLMSTLMFRDWYLVVLFLRILFMSRVMIPVISVTGFTRLVVECLLTDEPATRVLLLFLILFLETLFAMMANGCLVWRRSSLLTFQRCLQSQQVVSKLGVRFWSVNFFVLLMIILLLRGLVFLCFLSVYWWPLDELASVIEVIACLFHTCVRRGPLGT